MKAEEYSAVKVHRPVQGIEVARKGSSDMPGNLELIDDFPCYELWSLQTTLSALLTTHPRSKGQRPPPTASPEKHRDDVLKED